MYAHAFHNVLCLTREHPCFTLNFSPAFVIDDSETERPQMPRFITFFRIYIRIVPRGALCRVHGAMCCVACCTYSQVGKQDPGCREIVPAGFAPILHCRVVFPPGTLPVPNWLPTSSNLHRH